MNWLIKRLIFVLSISSLMYCSGNTARVNDRFSDRIQSLENRIIALEQNISYHMKIAITVFSLKDTNKGTWTVKEGEFVSDGEHRSSVTTGFFGPTLSEAEQNQKDQLLPMFKKEVRIKDRLYGAYSLTHVTKVTKSDSVGYSVEEPIWLIDFLKKMSVGMRRIINKDGQVASLLPQSDMWNNQKVWKYSLEESISSNVSVYYVFLYKKSGLDELPLYIEQGFKGKENPIPELQIQIETDASSPIGYMGYTYKYFGYVSPEKNSGNWFNNFKLSFKSRCGLTNQLPRKNLDL